MWVRTKPGASAMLVFLFPSSFSFLLLFTTQAPHSAFALTFAFIYSFVHFIRSVALPRHTPRNAARKVAPRTQSITKQNVATPFSLYCYCHYPCRRRPPSSSPCPFSSCRTTRSYARSSTEGSNVGARLFPLWPAAAAPAVLPSPRSRSCS